MSRAARMAKDPGAPQATASEEKAARGYVLSLSKEDVAAWARVARCLPVEFLESFRSTLRALAQVHAESLRNELLATLQAEIDGLEGKPVEREAVAGE